MPESGFQCVLNLISVPVDVELAEAWQEVIFAKQRAVAGSLYILLISCVNCCASKSWCKTVLSTSVKCFFHILNHIYDGFVLCACIFPINMTGWVLFRRVIDP